MKIINFKLILFCLGLNLYMQGANNLEISKVLFRRVRNTPAEVGALNAVALLASQLTHPLDKKPYSLDKEKLIRDFKELEQTEGFLYGLAYAARKQGIFLLPLELKSEEIYKLEKWQEPFILYLKGVGWVVGLQVKYDAQAKTSILTFLKSDGERGEIRDFEKSWDGKILSLPPPNGVIINRFIQGKKGELVVFYGPHKYKKSFLELENQLNEIRAKGKKMIAVLEDGGPESPEILKEMFPGLSLREAFEQYKIMIKTFLSRITEEGMEEVIKSFAQVPAQGMLAGSTFIFQVYLYLARNKIITLVEDLDYEFWRKRHFEILPVLCEKALAHFLKGEFEKYVGEVKRYSELDRENQGRRDQRFSRDLTRIVSENLEAVIVTIRGRTHYGLEEFRARKDVLTSTGIFGGDLLLDFPTLIPHLLVFPHNNVFLREDEKNDALAKWLLNLVLREGIARVAKADDLDEATLRKIPRDILGRISEKELREFSSLVKEKELNPEDDGVYHKLFQEFLSWLIEHKKILPEELNYFWPT